MRRGGDGSRRKEARGCEVGWIGEWVKVGG